MVICIIQNLYLLCMEKLQHNTEIIYGRSDQHNTEIIYEESNQHNGELIFQPIFWILGDWNNGGSG